MEANHDQRSTAVLLIILLALDIILDFQSIARYDKMWRGWALAGRTVIATGYTAVFAAYVATGGAFPEGYEYWGLGVEYAGALVYVLLWVLGYVLPRLPGHGLAWFVPVFSGGDANVGNVGSGTWSTAPSAGSSSSGS